MVSLHNENACMRLINASMLAMLVINAIDVGDRKRPQKALMNPFSLPDCIFEEGNL